MKALLLSALSITTGSVIRQDACASEVLPFEVQRGHIMVTATTTNSEPLRLMVDTGYGINMINPAMADKLGLRRVGSMTIVGIAGEERADTFAGLVLNLGKFTYEPRRVAALPNESRRRDGVLGAGFFRRFVVELNPTNKTMTLHDPDAFDYSGIGTVIPMTFRRDTPIIDAVMGLNATQTVSGRFEIDTGCDGGICVGSDFVKANQLLNYAKRNQEGSRSGVGGSARTVAGAIGYLQLGSLRVAKPQTQFFTEGSPVDAGLAGHIGWDALRRFKVTFDYSRRRLILEPLPAAIE
jgi:hypothetical protein